MISVFPCLACCIPASHVRRSDAVVTREPGESVSRSASLRQNHLGARFERRGSHIARLQIAAAINSTRSGCVRVHDVALETGGPHDPEQRLASTAGYEVKSAQRAGDRLASARVGTHGARHFHCSFGFNCYFPTTVLGRVDGQVVRPYLNPRPFGERVLSLATSPRSSRSLRCVGPGVAPC